MLSDRELGEAREHLARCAGCDRRYRFEEDLRHFVRIAVEEPMPDELRRRLADLRSSPPAAQP